MPNGTIVSVGDPRIRQVFFEADLLPEIRARISQGLGFPVNRIFFEAERNSVRVVVEALLNTPTRLLTLRIPPFRRGVVRYFHLLATITGTAHTRTIRYRPGRYGEALLRNPWDMDLMAAVVVGAFEALERRPLQAFWKEMDDGYFLRVEVAGSKPELSERLEVEFLPVKDGDFHHHSCPRCRLPLALRNLEWKEKEGIILDRRRGIRMLNWEAHSVRLVTRELVRELGEAVVPIIVQAETEHTLRMLEDLGLHMAAEEERGQLLQEMLSLLPLYGYGLATEVEFTRGGVLRVWIDNPYDEYLLAGRMAAYYQAMEGRRARVEWTTEHPATVSYILTPAD